MRAVVRKAERIRLPDKAGRTAPAYCFESLDYPVSDRKLNGYYVEIEAVDEPSEPQAGRGRFDVFRLQPSAQLPPQGIVALRGRRRRDSVNF